MNTSFKVVGLAMALAFGGLAASGPVAADNNGKGKGKVKAQKHERHDNDNDKRRGDSHDKDGKRGAWHDHRFGDNHRVAARDYYDRNYKNGRCPPGLAKKHNGCMPPGQAKKWEQGHALPRGVTYYSVPAPLVQQLGQPPAGYRYVRVNSDILLMETATRKIIDAIVNFGRS